MHSKFPCIFLPWCCILQSRSGLREFHVIHMKDTHHREPARSSVRELSQYSKRTETTNTFRMLPACPHGSVPGLGAAAMFGAALASPWHCDLPWTHAAHADTSSVWYCQLWYIQLWQLGNPQQHVGTALGSRKRVNHCNEKRDRQFFLVLSVFPCGGNDR